jgi:hypothetical protein
VFRREQSSRREYTVRAVDGRPVGRVSECRRGWRAVDVSGRSYRFPTRSEAVFSVLRAAERGRQ